jgi:hypothetical protein
MIEVPHDHARCHVTHTLPVCSNNAEIELESIRKRCHPLGSSSILGDHDRFAPVRHVVADPLRKDRLCVQVVNGTLEEALHLRGMKVDSDNVLNASDTQQVGKHASSNRTSMRLLL